MPTLTAYNRDRAYTIVRFWSPQQLLDAVQTEQFGASLSTEDRQSLVTLLREWTQRALGVVSLRDAFWVDPRRGKQVYDLLCTILTDATCEVQPSSSLTIHLSAYCNTEVQHIRDILAKNENYGDTHHTAFHTLLEQSEARALTLVYHDGEIHYPFPTDLDDVPPPSAIGTPMSEFVPPTGWRRTVASMLVAIGVITFVLPVLKGNVIEQPAGMPLGLLTLGLLVGIRAGWSGYSGALFLWLVANLPDFRHGAQVRIWSLALFLIGTLLLSRDEHVRALWLWVWKAKRKAEK